MYILTEYLVSGACLSILIENKYKLQKTFENKQWLPDEYV